KTKQNQKQEETKLLLICPFLVCFVFQISHFEIKHLWPKTKPPQLNHPPPARPLSLSWVTSTTAKRPCSTPFAKPTSLLANPAALRNTSAPIKWSTMAIK